MPSNYLRRIETNLKFLIVIGLEKLKFQHFKVIQSEIKFSSFVADDKSYVSLKV